jgi:hypothetical protein
MGNFLVPERLETSEGLGSIEFVIREYVICFKFVNRNGYVEVCVRLCTHLERISLNVYWSETHFKQKFRENWMAVLYPICFFQYVLTIFYVIKSYIYACHLGNYAKQATNKLLHSHCWLLALVTLLPWRRKFYVPPKWSKLLPDYTTSHRGKYPKTRT